MTLTQDQLYQLFEVVGVYAAACGFLFYVLGWICMQAAELLATWLRKRGAAAPFAERAAYAERQAERFSRVFRRMAERNRREAARRS